MQKVWSLLCHFVSNGVIASTCSGPKQCREVSARNLETGEIYQPSDNDFNEVAKALLPSTTTKQRQQLRTMLHAYLDATRELSDLGQQVSDNIHSLVEPEGIHEGHIAASMGLQHVVQRFNATVLFMWLALIAILNTEQWAMLFVLSLPGIPRIVPFIQMLLENADQEGDAAVNVK